MQTKRAPLPPAVHTPEPGVHGRPRRSLAPPVANRVKLKAFHKFDDTAEAVQSATALVEGKLSSGMKKFLKKNIVSKELEVRTAFPRLSRASS